jgi:hypothetical protein
MKTTIERIEAGELLPNEQLKRLGIAPRRMVRVVVETLDDGDMAPASDFGDRSDDEVMEAVDEEIAAYRREKRAQSRPA